MDDRLRIEAAVHLDVAPERELAAQASHLVEHLGMNFWARSQGTRT